MFFNYSLNYSLNLMVGSVSQTQGASDETFDDVNQFMKWSTVSRVDPNLFDLFIWLVVWNIFFSIMYGIILPIDFHSFQDG